MILLAVRTVLRMPVKNHHRIKSQPDQVPPKFNKYPRVQLIHTNRGTEVIIWVVIATLSMVFVRLPHFLLPPISRTLTTVLLQRAAEFPWNGKPP